MFVLICGYLFVGVYVCSLSWWLFFCVQFVKIVNFVNVYIHLLVAVV